MSTRPRLNTRSLDPPHGAKAGWWPHAGHLAGCRVSRGKVLSPNFGSHCKAGGTCQGRWGKKSLSPDALKLALTNVLSKQLCCKSLIWKENYSFHGSQHFFFVTDNMNTRLIPKIAAVGIFILLLGVFLINR